MNLKLSTEEDYFIMENYKPYSEVYCVSEMYLYSDVHFTRIYGLPLVAYFCHLESQSTGNSRIQVFLYK